MNQYDQVWAQYLNNRDKKESLKAIASSKFLLDHINFKDKLVLDLGCGDARDFVKYHDAGATKVVGIDSSDAMIEQAKRNTKGKDKIFLSDIVDFSFDNESFDIIIAKHSLHYIETLDPVWRKCSLALKTGGRIAITVPHPISETFLKDSKDYSKKEQIKFVAQGEFLLSFPSHRLNDYLSKKFLSHFNLELVWEYTKKEEWINGIIAPVVLGIIGTKKRTCDDIGSMERID